MALAKGKHGAEHPMANVEALALARSGRITLARQSSSRAINLAGQERGHEAAASYQAARAVWEAACGNAAEGEKNAIAALALSNARDVEYAAGLALALSGDAFSIGTTGRRFGTAVPGRYVRQIYVRASASRVIGTRPREAHRQRGAASHRAAL